MVHRGRRRAGARAAREPHCVNPSREAQADVRSSPRRRRSRGRRQRRQGALDRAQDEGQAVPLALRLHRRAARGQRRDDDPDASRARHRVGGAGHAAQEPARESDGQEAEGLPRLRAPASGPAPRNPHDEAGGSLDGCGARPVLRDGPSQDVRRAGMDQARSRAHRREPAGVRRLLPARDAAQEHRAAARGHEHGRPVRHLRDGRGRWSHGPGRRRPPRVVARAGALRRQVPTSAEEGGPPHARPADARAQEVRPAWRAAKVPVLEAVMAAMVRVAVAGASGYMGAELLRLLCVHPNMTLTGVTSDRLAGEALTKAYPHLRGLSELRFHDLDAEWLASVADVVFLALPHMESQKAVPILRRHGRRAIDLSADYRLRDPNDYVTWYKAPHIDLSGLGEAVYGLAELHRKAIAQAALVATPGCYPAGAILATAPLFRAGLARLDGVGIDGKSGVTGAGAQGRKIDPMYLYTEANENVQAYGIASHRHTPEIEQELGALAGAPVRVAFTPHLVPLNRGLFTTASVPLATTLSTAELLDVYRECYAGEPFVRVLDEGERPTTRGVVGSNYCDVTVVADPRTGRAVCLSAIDNLGKGGSANGVQNLNVMFGWPERTGLEAPPVYP